MLHDMDTLHNAVNWASLLKILFSSLGFYEVWLAQGAGNKHAFLSVVKQRLRDQFMQN